MIRYHSARQRGHGIGSLLGKMFRFAVPLLKSGLRVAKPHLMKAGKNVVSDVIRGKNLKRTLIEQGKTAAKSTLGDILSNPLAVPSAPPAKRNKPKQNFHINKRRRRRAQAKKSQAQNDIFD